MSTLVDCRFEALRAKGYAGTTSDMIREWLFFEVNGSSPATGHVNDLWKEFLEARGFWEGHINDGWYALLGSLGYEGQINDREKQFWCDGGDIGPITEPVLTDNFNIVLTTNSAEPLTDNTALPQIAILTPAPTVPVQSGDDNAMTFTALGILEADILAGRGKVGARSDSVNGGAWTNIYPVVDPNVITSLGGGIYSVVFNDGWQFFDAETTYLQLTFEYDVTEVEVPSPEQINPFTNLFATEEGVI